MTSKQIKFLTALLEESTISKAAVKAQISRKTAYKYLRDKEFQDALNQAKDSYINDAVRYLQSKLSMCNEVLMEIIENPNTKDQIRINAINTVYTNCRNMTEANDILSRLGQIEDSMRE